MKATEIHEKIKQLVLYESGKADEYGLRNKAQMLMLSIQSEKSLTAGEKEALINELREKIRPLACFDFKNGGSIYEINSLLSEMCLAASFYLLECEKRIRLYEAEDDIFVTANKRRFENCFFCIVSSLLKNNSEISVEIRSKADYCCILISAENTGALSEQNIPGNSFAVYEDSFKSISLNLKASSQTVDFGDCEDFSLLLFDSLSPMQVWLCDI